MLQVILRLDKCPVGSSSVGVRTAMGERVVQLPLPRYGVGESPYWIEDEQALSLVDRVAKTLTKYYVNTGRSRILQIGT